MGGARSQHGADQLRARRAATLVRLRDLQGSASGASFGVAVALALMGSTPFATEWLTRIGMTSAAFVGAVAAVFLALARGVQHTLRLLLAGVVVGVVFGALGSLIAMLQAEVMLAMQAFMLGSTSFVGWPACALMAAAWVLCMLTGAATCGQLHSAHRSQYRQ